MENNEVKQEPVSQEVAESVKFFEDNLSPLIRYGYNQACLDVLEILGDLEYQPPYEVVSKIHELMTTKKQVFAEDLKKEFIKD